MAWAAVASEMLSALVTWRENQSTEMWDSRFCPLTLEFRGGNGTW